MMAVSAIGFGPLLAFPEVPGWRGEVWVVTQPDLTFLREVRTVDLRDRAPVPRAARASGGGGLPAARRDGPPAVRAAPTLQPGSIQENLPAAPDFEDPGDPGIDGGFFDGPSTGPGTGPVEGPGDGPIDVRGAAGLPPDIVLPVPVETPSPRYPDTARFVRATGVVVLSATIAADGRVVDVEVENDANPLLVRAAVDAVSLWRYVPARIGSRPVAVILRVTLTFRLH
jgi:protein TonB